MIVPEIIKHLPILQVLISFISALFSILTFQYVIVARFISIFGIIINLSLAIYSLEYIISSPIHYVFGNWNKNIAIEFVLDGLNEPLIIVSNLLLLFFLTLGYKITAKTILNSIDKKRQSLFYAVLLFAHSGFIGMLSTNDLFNLYVFIEISSLSTYVLISQGDDARSYIASFDYLIIGTIGATLILVTIALLFSVTGALNMSEIYNKFSDITQYKVKYLAICFFLIGALLKIAFFPTHFWMIRSYSVTQSILLTYIAPISSLVGTYVILRFMHFIINYDYFINNFSIILKYFSLGSIIISTIFTLFSKELKHIIIYASCSQVGLFIFVSLISSNQTLLLWMIIIDAINKSFLFLIVAYMEIHYNNKLLEIFTLIVLFSNASLPLTPLFFIKIQIFELLLQSNMLIEFVILIISSSLSIIYYYNIFNIMKFDYTLQKC